MIVRARKALSRKCTSAWLQPSCQLRATPSPLEGHRGTRPACEVQERVNAAAAGRTRTSPSLLAGGGGGGEPHEPCWTRQAKCSRPDARRYARAHSTAFRSALRAAISRLIAGLLTVLSIRMSSGGINHLLTAISKRYAVSRTALLRNLVGGVVATRGHSFFAVASWGDPRRAQEHASRRAFACPCLSELSISAAACISRNIIGPRMATVGPPSRLFLFQTATLLRAVLGRRRLWSNEQQQRQHSSTEHVDQHGWVLTSARQRDIGERLLPDLPLEWEHTSGGGLPYRAPSNCRRLPCCPCCR